MHYFRQQNICVTISSFCVGLLIWQSMYAHPITMIWRSNCMNLQFSSDVPCDYRYFISVAVRISRPRPDSKPTPNSDMASCNLIKMSLIYFNFHKDLLKFNKLTMLRILHARSLNFIKFQYLEHEIFCFAKI